MIKVTCALGCKITVSHNDGKVTREIDSDKVKTVIVCQCRLQFRPVKVCRGHSKLKGQQVLTCNDCKHLNAGE